MRHAYGDAFSVTAAEISRNFGNWQDRAMVGPVIVTHHGRARVVLVSAEHYATWRDGGGGKEDGETGFVFETSLSAVLDHIREGFYALDHELRFTAINGIACDYFSRSRDQLIGSCITEAFPDLDGSMLINRVKSVMRSGLDMRFESKSSIFPGRTTEMTIFPYPRGVGIIFNNITEQRRWESDVQECASLILALSQCSDIAYIKLNARGAPTDVGDVACKMVGLSREEILNSRFIDLFPVRSRNAVHQAIERALQHSEPSILRSFIHSGVGEDIDIEISVAPIKGDLGVSGAIVLATPK